MSFPEKQGLYNPDNEHDSCGIGFVAHIKGVPSREILLRGFEVLCNMNHRGAVSADNLTGDGAGIFIQIPQADAGTRVAGLNAAVMALAHAGVPMKEMASAIAIGKIDKTLVVDVDKEEEDYKEGEGSTDIPMCYLSRSGKLALLQLDGKISVSELREALKMGKEACKKIYEIQKNTLKERGSQK